MRHIVSISLLLLALAPSAQAEEATTIGFEDAALDPMPPAAAAYADLIGGTLALEGDTMRVTLEIGAFPEMTPGLAYIFLFTDGAKEYWAGSVTAPDLVYAYGTWASDEEGPDDMRETVGSYAAGAPGSIEITFPLAYLNGSQVLSSPRGATMEIKGGASPVGGLPVFVVLDSAQGQGEMRLPAAATGPNETAEAPAGASSDDAPTPAAAGTPSPSPPAAVPGFAASAILGALGGALLAARRHSR